MSAALRNLMVGRDRWARRSHDGAGRRARRCGPTFGAAFVALFLCFATFARAATAETIPPAPRDHFNDYANVVSRATATRLEQELTQFERDTSTQLIVAIYPKMTSPSSIEDFTARVFEAWKVGQAKRDNGAVLFIFAQEHRMRLATGYGLEATLPDALCKQIIENEIAPRFRAGDFDGGVAAGARAMMAAVRGEYRGTGRTNAEAQRSSPLVGQRAVGGFGTLIFFVIIFLIVGRASRRSTLYGRRGRRGVWLGGGGPWMWGGGGGGWGGGGGGWSGGGGGGSFSGGGGNTGGGGASGSW